MRTVERLGPPNPDPLGIPDLALMVCELMVAFDHLKHEATMLAYARADGPNEVEAAYERSTRLIEDARAALRAPTPGGRRPATDRVGAEQPAGFVPNMSREEFEANVARIIEYIRAGDAYQVVPSQRFTRAPVEAFSIYRGPRTVNLPVHVLPRVRRLPDRRRVPEPLVKVAGDG